MRKIYTDWMKVPLFMTREEAGLLLRVTPETVRRLCASGQLAAIQVGKQWRIDRESVRAMLDARAQTARA